MTDRKDMTAKQQARVLWEEMKERHERELANLHIIHCKDVIRVIGSHMAERDNVIKVLGDDLGE